jgi:hypothetical protein
MGRPLCLSRKPMAYRQGRSVDCYKVDGELRFAAELGEAHALHEELRDFRRHVTSAGRATYQARTGKHDDLVLAVAMAREYDC